MTERQTVISGDWLRNNEDRRYPIGFVATVPTCARHEPEQRCHDCTWNGWAIPRVSAGVLETIVRHQCEMNQEYPQDADVEVTLRIEGRTLIHTYEGEEYRIEPDTDGRYEVSLGWCWEEVPAEECETIIG